MRSPTNRSTCAPRRRARSGRIAPNRPPTRWPAAPSKASRSCAAPLARARPRRRRARLGAARSCAASPTRAIPPRRCRRSRRSPSSTSAPTTIASSRALESLRRRDGQGGGARARAARVDLARRGRARRALGALERALADTRWDVRRQAVLALADYGAMSQLFARRGLEHDPLVLAAIASALAGARGER